MTEKRNRRALEAFKTVVIILLALSAVYLTVRTQLFRGLMANLKGDATAGTSGESLQTGTEFLRPVRLALMSEGGRYAVQYDAPGSDALFDRVAGLLAEALGSAERPAAVDRTAWEAALTTSPSLYFDLLGSVPLETLQRWLASGQSNTALTGSVRRLALAAGEDDTVLLYYINESDGSYYACRTDVLKQGQLLPAVSGYSANGAWFAFEMEEETVLTPDALLLEQVHSMSGYTASNPLSAGADAHVALVEVLDFSTQSNANYAAADGMVYKSGADTLRISNTGLVTYTGSSASPPRFPVAARSGGEPAESDLVWAAAALLQQTVQPNLGEGRLYLRRVSRKADGSGEVEFGYCLAGAEVNLGDGLSAARFTIEDGRITAFTLCLRTYAGTGAAAPVLPERQALAAAAALGAENAELRLCYRDSLTEPMSAGWIAD